ncbi:hypothetical protein GQ457_04G026160 [Hibiscus cannabinus]
MVRIFYSNARCIVNEDETKTIGVESYIMGRTILLDVATITNHLGLKDDGGRRRDNTYSFCLCRGLLCVCLRCSRSYSPSFCYLMVLTIQ